LQLLQIFIFKIPAAGTHFTNTVFLPATAKLAGKYRLGRWNTDHLATLLRWGDSFDKLSIGMIFCIGPGVDVHFMNDDPTGLRL